MTDLLRDIKHLVKRLAYGVEVVSRASKFSNDQHLNLKKLGKGKGVRALTVYNSGTHTIYISGANKERQPIDPEDTYSTNSQHRLVDEVFIIEFGEKHPDVTDPDRPEAILRYTVDVPYCES